MKPIFTWRSERSSTISQLNQGWLSQELGPEIKSTYQGLKRTAQPKIGMTISVQMMLSCLGSSIDERKCQCQLCWATTGSTKTKDNDHIPARLMITTERQFFMKAKKSQVSLIHWPTHVSKCHKHKCNYTQIYEDFLKRKGRYYDLK